MNPFRVRRLLRVLWLSALPIWSASVALAQAVVGTGATFPAKVYVQWAEAYSRQTGHPLVYRPAGSSAGVQGVSERTADFGATDVPLSAAELDKRGLFQFPTLVGGIVPVVNLPGVAAGQLRLDAATLARIWSGDIDRWNDAAIRALNPGLDLPGLAIRRVVRSDGSGTTTVFVQYLRQAAATEAAGIQPDGGRARWPGQVIAADGTDRLVATVKATPGAIGYASSDHALREKLAGVRLRNLRGEFVEPAVGGFRAAITAGNLFKHGLEPTPLLDLDGAGVWPIVTATYVLVPREPKSIDRAARTLNFFFRSFQQGDKAVAGTGFAPLPILVQARIVGLLSNFRTPAGHVVPVLGAHAGEAVLASR